MNSGHVIGGLLGAAVLGGGYLLLRPSSTKDGSSPTGGTSMGGGSTKPVGTQPLAAFEYMSSWPVMQQKEGDEFHLFAVDIDDYTEAVDVFEPFMTRYLASHVRVFLRKGLEASDPDVRRIALSTPPGSDYVEVTLT